MWMTKTHTLLDYFVPAGVGLAVCLITLSTAISGFGPGIYEALRVFRPPITPIPGILVIETEGGNESAPGTGKPLWNMSDMAEALLVLKEMEAGYAILDLPFSGEAFQGNTSTLARNELQKAFDREFSRIDDNVRSLFDAIRTGSIRPRDSSRYVTELIGTIDKGKTRLLDLFERSGHGDDLRLAKAMVFFGKTYIAMEIVPATATDSAAPGPAGSEGEVERLILRKQAIRRATTAGDKSPAVGKILTAPPVLLETAAGGGFTGNGVDPDGIRLSMLPVVEYRGRRLAQVALAALLDRLGDPIIDLEKERIILRNVKMPGAIVQDIDIPLTDDARVLIEWPASDRDAAGTGFRRIAWGDLRRYGSSEEEFLAILRDMEREGFLGDRKEAASLLSLYDYAAIAGREMLDAVDDASGIAPSRIDVWRENRSRFFDLAGRLLDGDAENRLTALDDGMLASDGLAPEEERRILIQRERARDYFRKARTYHQDLAQLRSRFKERLPGSLCLISLPASQAKGMDTVTRESSLSKAEMSAAFVNAVLSKRFIAEIPNRRAAALGALVSVLIPLAAMRLRPWIIATLAIVWIMLAISLSAVLLAFPGVWLSPLAPAGGPAMACITALALKLRREGVPSVSEAP
jgi:hypothetical protein